MYLHWWISITPLFTLLSKGYRTLLCMALLHLTLLGSCQPLLILHSALLNPITHTVLNIFSLIMLSLCVNHSLSQVFFSFSSLPAFVCLNRWILNSSAYRSSPPWISLSYTPKHTWQILKHFTLTCPLMVFATSSAHCFMLLFPIYSSGYVRRFSV